MALGGGTFVTQNKILPGSYVKFVSTSRTDNVFSDRGVAAIALDLNWGAEHELMAITAEEFEKNCPKYFGVAYTSDEVKGMRDLFKHATKVYVYRLNEGGAKAANDYATAKYAGTTGNTITIKLEANPDMENGFIVNTLLGTSVVDKQYVTKAEELVANDFVDFKNFTANLDGGTIVSALTGGTTGEAGDAADHTAFLAAIEPKYLNAVIAYTDASAIANLYVAFAHRMRESVGSQLQVVVYHNEADFEGVVNVHNTTKDGKPYDALFWAGGVIAGCEVNKSNTNKKYDGEFTIDVALTQTELEAGLKAGKFMFHQVGDDVRVLEDINSLVSVTAEKTEDFKYNQTIRVLDQIVTDTATIFNTKYLGVIPNNNAGRISLWNDIVSHHKTLQDIAAIENFVAADVIVEQGENRRSVKVTDAITPVNAMSQLYMEIIVR